MSDASHKSVPEWAIERACDLLNQEEVKGTLLPARWTASADGSRRPVLAFARYIAEHEEEPVDPLLIEAREIVAQTQHDRWIADSPWHANEAEQMRAGKRDGNLTVMAAHEGLKRGIEIGGAK